MHSIFGFVNRVIPGDCVDVMRRMPERSVDFVLTDPPYAVRYRDRSGRTLLNDDSTDWLLPAFAEVARVLKDNRFCVSFYGWPRADAFLEAWRSVGLRPVGHLVFVKLYRSNDQVRFLNHRHEQAYLLAKGYPRPVHTINDVLDWEYTGNRHHPTEKPVSALTPLVGAFSRPHDIVLDPFAGSGSTAVAARDLGRRYIAIELATRHCETAAARLRAA